MAYTINQFNGNVLTTLTDGTINQSFTVTLVGKNYSGYGAFLDENFIWLMENFANSTAPANPLVGQLWYDSGIKTLKVYDGTNWKNISSSAPGPVPPPQPIVGDLWFNTILQQLFAWNGTAWLLIGPPNSSGEGRTGAFPATIRDTASNDHIVLELIVGANVGNGSPNSQSVAIVSRDATFTPNSTVPGYATINPGINLPTSVLPYVGANSALQSPAFYGNTIQALSLAVTSGSSTTFVNGNAFMRADQNTSTIGTVSILNNSGLNIGANGQLSISAESTLPGNVVFSAETANTGLIFEVAPGGTPFASITIDRTGLVTIPRLSTANSNSTLGNITVLNIVNGNPPAGAGNIGSSANPFNTIFAKATSAQYADVAERFAADDHYPCGTVVELGGEHEITLAKAELSDMVFGVISTAPAYLLNSTAGTDITHPAVAMTGRVPVRVIGSVKKGDRLVSAGNGIARAAKQGEATPFNTIGRALVNKLDSAEGEVEAIVATK
jgi:hypothetical protein